jgi:hypothetical protein
MASKRSYKEETKIIVMGTLTLENRSLNYWLKYIEIYIKRQIYLLRGQYYSAPKIVQIR